MDFDRYQAKMDVKAALRDCRPHRALITLVFTLVVSAVSGAVNGVFSALSGGGQQMAILVNQFLEMAESGRYTDTMPQEFAPLLLSTLGRYGIAAILASIIIAIFNCIANTGYDGFTLAASRRDPQPAEKIFSVFPMWLPVIGTAFCRGLLSFLWTALFAFAYIVLVTAGTLVTSFMPVLGIPLILLGAALFIAGIVWVDLRYALTNFHLLDQGISGMAALTASKQMMKGNYGKLLLLDLSFLPWYLPSIIGFVPTMALLFMGTMPNSNLDYMVVILFVALWLPLCMLIQSIMGLFLRPYQGACHARFYDTLRGYIPLTPPTPPYQNGPQNYRYSWTDSAPNSGIGTAGNDPWSNSGNWTKTSSSEDSSTDTWDQGRGSPTDFD